MREKKHFVLLEFYLKLYGQLRKTALSLTPQEMHNQFKTPSAGSLIELYYIYRKT